MNRSISRFGTGLAVAGLAFSIAVGLIRHPPGLGEGPLTSHWDVGLCHRLDQPEETGWVFTSDTRPPVPCDSPHQTETFQVTEPPSDVAAHKELPSPVLLRRAGASACSYDALYNYLGPDNPVAARKLKIIQFFPTHEEWENGERRVRCDVAVAQEGDEQRNAVLTGSVRAPDTGHGR